MIKIRSQLCLQEGVRLAPSHSILIYLRRIHRACMLWFGTNPKQGAVGKSGARGTPLHTDLALLRAPQPGPHAIWRSAVSEFARDCTSRRAEHREQSAAVPVPPQAGRRRGRVVAMLRRSKNQVWEGGTVVAWGWGGVAGQGGSAGACVGVEGPELGAERRHRAHKKLSKGG